MPTALASLPRELRQHIFALAFDDAATKDHRLNENIRTCIRRHDGLIRLEYNKTVAIFRETLGPTPSQWPKIHAPTMSRLAFALCATYPNSEGNIMYVLEGSRKHGVFRGHHNGIIVMI